MNIYGHFLEEADEGAVEHFDNFLNKKINKNKSTPNSLPISISSPIPEVAKEK